MCLLLPRLLTLHFAPSNEAMGYFRTHAYGGWISYGGTDAIVLVVILIALATVFAFVGARLQSPIALRRPGQTVSGFMIAIWALAICTFLVSIRAYAIQLKEFDLLVTPPRVQVGTLPDAAVAFLIILFLTRGYGWRGAFASAFVGTAAAPMFFELPFDLIVMGRTYPAIPPDPMLYRALFFLPLFILELSTISLLTLLPSMRITRHALYALAGMFAVFAIWAAFGFGIPTELLPRTLNIISKMLCFVAAIMLFVWRDPETPMSGTLVEQSSHS
jgi:hypothetical protein